MKVRAERDDQIYLLSRNAINITNTHISQLFNITAPIHICWMADQWEVCKKLKVYKAGIRSSDV